MALVHKAKPLGGSKKLELVVHNGYSTHRSTFSQKGYSVTPTYEGWNIETEINSPLKVTLTPLTGTNEINFLFLKSDGKQVSANTYIGGNQWVTITQETTVYMSGCTDEDCIGVGYQVRSAGTFKCIVEAE